MNRPAGELISIGIAVYVTCLKVEKSVVKEVLQQIALYDAVVRGVENRDVVTAIYANVVVKADYVDTTFADDYTIVLDIPTMIKEKLVTQIYPNELLIDLMCGKMPIIEAAIESRLLPSLPVYSENYRKIYYGEYDLYHRNSNSGNLIFSGKKSIER